MRFSITAAAALVAVLGLVAVGSATEPMKAQVDRIAQQALKLSKSNKRAIKSVRTTAEGAQQAVSTLQGSAISDVLLVESPVVTVPPGGTTFGGSSNSLRASCPTGYGVIGTGFSGDFGDMWAVQSYEFFVSGFGTNDASISGDFQVQAICAKGATQFRASRKAARSDYRQDLREAQAKFKRVEKR